MGNILVDNYESDDEPDYQQDWYVIKYREKQNIDYGIYEIHKLKIGPFKNLDDAKKIVEERNLREIDQNLRIEKKYTSKHHSFNECEEKKTCEPSEGVLSLCS